jgi:hypothetical protein
MICVLEMSPLPLKSTNSNSLAISSSRSAKKLCTTRHVVLGLRDVPTPLVVLGMSAQIQKNALLHLRHC